MAETNKPEDFFEDPLENLLDDQSDEEFGLPEFKEHLADHLKPAKLKDWTAADFASIYVRFRPHLERHARRFLVNPSQVEEVVQDAFLYLMTTLPELDSEVGVLKFLKWKTRLLALDVIRANSRASFAPIDDVPEMAAKDAELSEDLERADDAAIVALAMAKLQPRHREALIATMYEEKSQEVVAAQMGLSENALRQLLFRARASFKKALVGEAEIAGKSMSEVLSIAARKAARESGKYITAAGAFLLVLAVSIGILPNIGGLSPEANIAEPAATQSTSQAPEQPAEAQPEITSPAEAGSAQTPEESVPPRQDATQEPSILQNIVEAATPVGESEDSTATQDRNLDKTGSPGQSTLPLDSESVPAMQTLATFEAASLVTSTPVESKTSVVRDGDAIRGRVEVSESVVAFLTFSPDTKAASGSVEVDTGNSSFTAVATWVVAEQVGENLYRVSFADFVFVDRTKSELAPYFSRRVLQVWVDTSSQVPSLTFDFS